MGALEKTVAHLINVVRLINFLVGSNFKMVDKVLDELINKGRFADNSQVINVCCQSANKLHINHHEVKAGIIFRAQEPQLSERFF